MDEFPQRTHSGRYIAVGAIGVLLLISPEAVPAILEQAFNLETLGNWASRIGTAALIGATLGFLLDRWQIRSITRLTESKINKINRDVFDGVFNSTVDNEIYDLFRQSVLLCPVYRDPFKLSLTLTCENYLVGGQNKQYIKCEWYEDYWLRSLQSPKAIHDFKVSVATYELQGFEDKCGITRMVIDGQEFAGNPFIGVADPEDEHTTIFQSRLEIPINRPIRIESRSVCYKTMSDGETFEVAVPSKNVELEVHVNNCDLIVRPHIMAVGGWKEGGRHGREVPFHWQANSAMMPQQGISLTWTPR